MSSIEAKNLQEENARVVEDVAAAPDREAKTDATAGVGDKRKGDEVVLDEDAKKARTDDDSVTGKGKGKAAAEPSPEPSLDDSDVEEDLPPRRARANIDYSSAKAHEVAGIDPNAADEDEKDEDAKIVEDIEGSGDEPANDVAEEEDEEEDDDEEK